MRLKFFFLISPLRVTAQRRLTFKSASRAYCPYLHFFIAAAGGKLAAVVVPGDGHDTAQVTVHRARGVGLDTTPSMRARTIRVVMAGKLLEKLILQALILLSLHSIKAFVGTCAPSGSISTDPSARSRS